PLEKLCIEAGEPQQGARVKFDEDEESSFLHAFYMSMGFGFAVGFWGIFGSILFKRSRRHAYFRFLNNLMDNIYTM
ncbi:hypothetical protein PIB30_115823, partial [Stylosanthes scabra]|nr:hypothetical protein [Stylosanthes scabra]